MDRIVKVLGLILMTLMAFNWCHADDSKDRYLSLPKLDKCNNRFKEFQYKNRNYFYSGHNPELKDKRFDWLDARNTCRDYCMETISFEDQEKFDFFKTYIEKHNVSFIWTSGRLCDFDGCEGRWDLLPKRIKGWLWSANQASIADTNKTPPGWNYQPWSSKGIRKKPQPDNAEYYISQTSESCLGVLNNMYNDSVAWHDIACYHQARFICEDSELLLKEVLEQKNEPTDNGEENTFEKAQEISTTETIASTKNVEMHDEKDLSTNRRRKILSKELKTEMSEQENNSQFNKKLQKMFPSEERSISETEENNTFDTIPALTVEEESLERNETLNSTDDAKEEQKAFEELETTTFVEEISTTTRPSRGRGRGRGRRN